MVKVYIAAPWAHREEAKTVRDKFVAKGFTVTSRWLDVDETTCSPVEEAHNDLVDILEAGVMVVLNLEKSEGKAFEQGFAMAHEKPIFVIGDPANYLNIFQLLRPAVTFAYNVDEVIDALEYWYR